MFINKIGQSHLDYGINNQDYGLDLQDLKCVVDGCSEGKNSEIGAKLFCLKLQRNYKNGIYYEELISQLIFDIFKKIDDSDLLNYMLFTILIVKKHHDLFEVNYCGDGYILFIDYNNKLEIKRIVDGDINGYPLYFSYKFLDEEKLNGIKYEDCDIKKFDYSINDYKKIGVATDGLRYIFGTEFEEQFKQYIIEDKEIQLKRLINKYQNTFKDDITISI
jgi:hypothetical protein